MLKPDDAEEVLKNFETNERQVQRDHAISHVLFALQKIESQMVFFGGTALARTYLPSGRLSEDIDLFTNSRTALSQEINDLPSLIEREFPNASWALLPSRAADAQDIFLRCDDLIQVKMQIVESKTRGWEAVPVQSSVIFQRYSDVPPTSLTVPTFDGFIAMKALAWFDRRAARDLFDLEGLSAVHEVTEMARNVVEQIRGYPLSGSMMRQRPIGLWSEELAHQTKLEKSEAACLARVLEWWGA